jgi:hypothetical protein
MRLVGYLYEGYHDARSLEHKVSKGYCDYCGPYSQRAKLLRVGPTWRKEHSSLLPEFVLANKKSKRTHGIFIFWWVIHSSQIAFGVACAICGQFKVLFPRYIGLNEGLQSCYSSPNVITPIKSEGGGIRLAEYVAHTRNEGNSILKFGLKNWREDTSWKT